MRLTNLLFSSLILTFSTLVYGSKSKEILSLDEFNEIINSHPSDLDNDYATLNVIKYYTTWCSHCKRLTPIWKQLISDFKDDNRVNFVSIDCDIFGSNLCSGLPGYPIIKVVTTTGNDVVELKNDDDDVETNSGALGWVKSWFKRDRQELIHIDPERFIDYRGARNLEQITNFINQLLKLDQLQADFSKIVYKLDENLDATLLDGYYSKNLVQKKIVSLDNGKVILVNNDNKLLDKERNKLENMIRNNGDDESQGDLLRVKVQFINWLEDQVGNSEEDTKLKDEL